MNCINQFKDIQNHRLATHLQVGVVGLLFHVLFGYMLD